MKLPKTSLDIESPDNIFVSKSDTLKFLKKRVKKSKIEKIFDFTVSEWKHNKSDILSAISKNFNSQRVIIRSSAMGEDSPDTSKAGTYQTLQNIDSTSRIKIKKAIDKVIESYNKKGNKNYRNKILIQTHTGNIITSGVAFTRTPHVAAPYYVINFEDGSSTDSVTQGQIGSTTKLFRGIKTSNIPKKWKNLINSLKEIEKIIRIDLLDVEFGITKNEIVIFQVRPLTSVNRHDISNLDKKIEKLISKNKEKFLQLNKSKHIPGNHTIFSDMSDWNPAEIIGNNPNRLDYSLYNYLIMKKTWRQGRKVIGYQNVDPHGLMTRFGNKPYIDIRASFNSLIPKKIKKKYKEKLINFYLQKLSERPYLHDKVEFEILFTCFDFTINSRLKELKKFGFNDSDIIEIENTLKEFTNEIVQSFPKILMEYKALTYQVHKNRAKIILKLKNPAKRNPANLLSCAEELLKTSIKFQTPQFSAMARIAFIGSTMLKSLHKGGFVKRNFIENFMETISTPITEIQDDVESYIHKKISKDDFLKKYGHLRPGTYDITSLRYDKENQFFDNIKFIRRKKKTKFTIKENQISKILKKYKLNFNGIDFVNFVQQSLVQREKLKFEFTKNLSEALELVAEAGKKLGFSRDELANLDIQTIFKYKNKDNLKNILKNKIKANIDDKVLNDYLVTPPIIFSTQDFDVINYHISKPNYITSKTLSADVVRLKNKNEKFPDLDNKIAIIENADPGYDWIFTKNLAGLITKYGGVASHMAIRCAEIGIPAAIGCGDILFDQLEKADKVLLDCDNQQVVILQHQKYDERIEEKKILKSLGYIK